MNDLLSLMHDTAHDLLRISTIEQKISKIAEKIVRKESLDSSDSSVLYIAVEYLKTSRRDISKRLDEYYVKEKEKNG